MLTTKPYEFWFLTGSQHLYGDDALQEVENNSKEIVKNLGEQGNLPYKIVFKTLLTNAADIHQVMLEANNDDHCAGVITWMHTFSPAKMWIACLSALQKYLLHLHS